MEKYGNVIKLWKNANYQQIRNDIYFLSFMKKVDKVIYACDICLETNIIQIKPTINGVVHTFVTIDKELKDLVSKTYNLLEWDNESEAEYVVLTNNYGSIEIHYIKNKEKLKHFIIQHSNIISDVFENRPVNWQLSCQIKED